MAKITGNLTPTQGVLYVCLVNLERICLLWAKGKKNVSIRDSCSDYNSMFSNDNILVKLNTNVRMKILLRYKHVCFYTS